MPIHHRVIVAAALVTSIALDLEARGQFGVLKKLPGLRSDSQAEYIPFRDPAEQFALEHPKDWQVIAGAGDVVATFAQKKSDAALIVERFRMNTALAPEDITEVFVQIETDVLKERQPKATEVTAKILNQNSRRIIVIDYARPGLSGPERARQYSFPTGQVLYRLTASARTALFAKYDAVFVHVAESFTAASANGTPERR